MTQLVDAGQAPDEVVFDRGWWSGPGAHGGLLVAEALRHAAAALDLGPFRTLRSVSVQLLSTVGEPPIRLTPTVLRAGGSATSVALRADQEGEVRMFGHAVFGASRPGDVAVAAPSWQQAAPEVVPPEEAPLVPSRGVVPFTQHLEYRSADGSRPLGGGRPTLTAWFRLREPTAVDAAQAVFLLDAMAPGVYGQLRAPVAVPTLDYTVHIHAPLDVEPLEPGAWVLGRQHCVTAADGWAVDDGTLWDVDGRLLATARQLRRVF